MINYYDGCVGRKEAAMRICGDARMPIPKFRASDLKELRSRFVPGKKFSVVVTEGEERGTRKRYTVVKRYPYHVSCVDRKGIHESFNYFQLAVEAKAVQ